MIGGVVVFVSPRALAATLGLLGASSMLPACRHAGVREVDAWAPAVQTRVPDGVRILTAEEEVERAAARRAAQDGTEGSDELGCGPMDDDGGSSICGACFEGACGEGACGEGACGEGSCGHGSCGAWP